MKIDKGLMAIIFIGGYLWREGQNPLSALESKITNVRIVNFWQNLGKGVFELDLIFVVQNHSDLDITVHDFMGLLTWRGNKMAKIALDWANAPLLPGQMQKMPFKVGGKFIDGIAAVILTLSNPGARLLEGVQVDGDFSMTVNGKKGTIDYHQEIAIIL